ncbi:ribbon-helix-helix protein, CopG family [Lysinibacillus sp. NPDC096418]|uniref:ribbon-helix-helix protein, CopG family n=1 Tax=Lysinibacillus sp. NPDC096418 TaxID=3364138 RepID=UPI0038010B0E
MKQYPFYVEKSQLDEFTSLVPSFRRSKFIREFLKSDFQGVINPPEDSVGEESVFFYLDDKAIGKIDQIVKRFNSNRSAVMREILNSIIEKHRNQPVEYTKGLTRSFTVAPGTLEQLKLYIAHGERDNMIEEFLLDVYNGPIKKSVSELKSRPKGGTESLIVTLSTESYEKLEHIAVELGNKVKRSHIFKDCIEQFVFTLQDENPQRLELERQLETTIEGLKGFVNQVEIRESVEKYLKR